MKPIPKVRFRQSSEIEKRGFEFLPFGQLHPIERGALNHDPFQWHRLEFNLIFLITAGSVRHRVDFQEVELRAGSALLIHQGQVHAFHPEDHYQGYLLLFSPSFIKTYMSADWQAQFKRLTWQKRAPEAMRAPFLIDQLIERLGVQSAGDKGLSTRKEAALLALFWEEMKFFDEEEGLEQGLGQKRMNRLNELLAEHYKKERSAQFYASALGMSYKHFNNFIKSTTGDSAKNFIDQFIVLEIQRSLILGEQNIQELSDELSFDSAGNFQKYFKRIVGMSPLAFKKQQLKVR